MERRITPEERNILLDNPELVMFEPWKAFKERRSTLIEALILPVIIVCLILLLIFLCPSVIEAYPTIFTIIAMILLILACAFMPVFRHISQDRAFKKALETHYAKYLEVLLPSDLSCNVAEVHSVVYEKCEGQYIIDGQKSLFSYSGFVNVFKPIPDTDVAIVYGKGFYAFVKRDPKTESFYERLP